MTAATQLDIVMPVYREADTIAATLRDIDAAVSALVPSYRFVISADAGPDRTIEVLQDLERHLPMSIEVAPIRRGYSAAVRSGLLRARAPYVLCLDSDGQFDPADIGAFWQHRDRADVISGWRVHRADPGARRAGSAAFALLYRRLFAVPLHDPSSSLVLCKRDVATLLLPRMGNLPEGFWWEFNAAAWQMGLTFAELPVRHRRRAGGSTQLFSVRQLPGVVFRQTSGLLRMAASR